jgi:hypothetical protein
MAGQAGWYRAPGEEGLLRYWNGTGWTEHRQPAPVVAEVVAPAAPTPPVAAIAPDAPIAPIPPIESSSSIALGSSTATNFSLATSQPAASAPAAPTASVPMPASQRHLATEPLVPQPAAVAQATETDWSMDQFEKQFEEQFAGSTESEQDVTASPSSAADVAADPYATSASRFAPSPTVTAPTPAGVQSAPVAPVADPAKPSATEIAFAAATATAGVERIRRNRKRVMGPVRGMVVGLLFVLVGVALIFISTAQNNPPGGELKANGIITSLGSPKVGCSPIARFAAVGGSYTTAPGAAISPCPVGLGQSVNVFYSRSHPGTTGTISSLSSISTIDWAVTGIGALLLLGSAVVFIARAGSVSRGVAVIRDGELAEVAASKNRP